MSSRKPAAVLRNLPLVLSVLLVACEGEPRRRVEEKPPDLPGPCVAAPDACVGKCGPGADSCGKEVDCGSCVDEAELAWRMQAVERLLGILENRSYMTDVLAIDREGLLADARQVLRDTPDTDLAQMTALTRTLRAFRNGHSAVGLSASYCKDAGGADLSMTAYGVCAKPWQDHFVVTHRAGSTNPLALQPGERITKVNGLSGRSMIDALLRRPLCGNGAGNASVDHEHAAEALFSLLRPGDRLAVTGLDGAEREVVAARPSDEYVECRFPAGRVQSPLVEARLRDDGVAVVRLRRFTLFPGERGYINVTTEAEAWQLIGNIIEQVRAEFDRVKAGAAGIVWDVRGNIGGASPVGFAIAEGMPGARRTELARCTTRIANTNPIRYHDGGPYYELAPSESPFGFTGRTAVLVDGLTISAGDYFALAVRKGTDAKIFGRPAAGAYGGGGNIEYLESRKYHVGYDPFRCNTPEGEPLETHSIEPDFPVEYAPQDLAAGRDTVLEAAAEWIRTAP